MPNRYLVKVLSEERRTIKQTTGDMAGVAFELTCRKVFNHFACNDAAGSVSWLFEGNNFVRAYMLGTIVAGDDNIWISYGTCTGF